MSVCWKRVKKTTILLCLVAGVLLVGARFMPVEPPLWMSRLGAWFVSPLADHKGPPSAPDLDLPRFSRETDVSKIPLSASPLDVTEGHS